jgi:hypothetical protein
MRRGKAPTVRRGPYAGDKFSVDHIIPRAVCPEVPDNWTIRYNLACKEWEFGTLPTSGA